MDLQEGESLYQIGVNTNCPVHQATVGGQCFPRMSEKVSGYGAETVRQPINGAIVVMQSGQPERIMEEIKFKLIRSTDGKRARARIVDTRSKRYRANRQDVPLADYVYMRPLDARDDPHAEVAEVTLSGKDPRAEDEQPKAKGKSKPKAASADEAKKIL